MEWDKSWLKELDTTKIKMLPIQIANICRIENNDAVYIFDEVGSGKSISSGLMIRHFIENVSCNENYDVDCLVITVNANVTPSIKFINTVYQGMGAFEKKIKEFIDLYDGKEIRGKKVKIKFINNDYRNIANYIGKKIGIVIIDEVHTFSGFDTRRKENIKKLCASKVVMMTATPFKRFNAFESGSGVSGEQGMLKDIVRKIIKNDDYDIDFSNYFNNEDNRFISNRFDKEWPVTRYFKDTILSLKTSGPSEPKTKRLMTEIINCGDDCSILNKSRVIVNKICELRESSYNNDEPHRFIIFTRYKKGEQDVLKKVLDEKGFIEYTNDMFNMKLSQINYLTYRIINGETKDISHFTKKRDVSNDESIPDVLVITSQIADQGIDLPSYSHVVNLYIPSNPASLEQRFGRVDRLDKDDKPLYNEITMWYVVSNVPGDTYANNLIESLYIYMSNLLVINYPSKNVLFDKDKILVTEYNNNTERRKYYFNDIEEKLNKIKDLGLEKQFYEIYESKNLSNYYGRIDENSYNILSDLINFVDNYCEKLMDKNARIKNNIDNANKFLIVCRLFIERNIKKIDKDKIDMDVVNNIIKHSDDIFYIDEKKGFQNYNSWNECALAITNDNNYKSFLEELINNHLIK